VEAVAAAKQLTTETGTSWYVVKARSQVDVVKVVELLAKNLQQVKKFQNKLSECSYYTANICGR
jgi:succinyl-CoA synthetase beta subunit